MSSINTVRIDLSKLSPAQLEYVAQQAFRDRTAAFVPFLWASWMDSLCLGVLLVVTRTWWIRARVTDRRTNRYLVYWLLTMALAFTATNQYYLLDRFAAQFGVYRNFLDIASVKVFMLLGIAVRVPAMLFYLHRAYIMQGGATWIIWLVSPLIAFIIAAPIANAVMLKSLPFSPQLNQILAVAFICEVVADLIITGVIAWNLHSSKTGWASTDRMIRRLLFTLAETQAPPTVFSLIVLVLFYTSPNSTILTCFAFSPKIGVLCILLTLLSRVHIVESHVASSMSGRTHRHSESQSHTPRQGQLRTVVRSTNRPTTFHEGTGWQQSPEEGDDGTRQGA